MKLVEIEKLIKNTNELDQVEKLHPFLISKITTLVRSIYAVTFLLILIIIYYLSINYWSPLELNLIIIRLKPSYETDIVAFCALIYLNFRVALLARDYLNCFGLLDIINQKIFADIGGMGLTRFTTPFSILIGSIGLLDNTLVKKFRLNLIALAPIILVMSSPLIVQIIWTLDLVDEIDENILKSIIQIALSIYFIVLTYSSILIKR